MYRWWVFVHLLGVFGFIAAHGVSILLTFRLRSERDPRRVVDLIELSSASIVPFYLSLGVLLVSGIVAGTLGGWWDRAWIWASIGLLLGTSAAMFAMAKPYTERVGMVARSLAEGSEAVSDEQFERVRRAPSGLAVAWIGFVGLAAILYLMMFKPSLGLTETASAGGSSAGALAPGAIVVRIAADNEEAFSTNRLAAPAGEAFGIEFANHQPGIPHNVAIYGDQGFAEPVFVGELVDGGSRVTYSVGPLRAGTYSFRCDVHPVMTGALEVG